MRPVGSALQTVAFSGVTATLGLVGEATAEEGGGSDLGPVIGGLVVLGAVFAIGLSAIRRQRAEGRTSKFPRIG